MNRKRFRADDPERRSWQDPEKIFSSIGLRKGMVLVDVGCGEGYFCAPCSPYHRAGREGLCSRHQRRCCGKPERTGKNRRITQPVSRSSGSGSAIACEGCADIVFFGIDLHDFADPEQVIRNAKTMLRPSGRLIDLDWKDIPMDFGPPAEKRFPVAKAKNLIESAGFTVRSVQDAGPYHYLIIAGR